VPRVWGPTNDNVEEMLEQVAEGAAICIASASMARYYARPDLSWVPLTDVEPLQIALAWVDGADTPLVRDSPASSASSAKPRVCDGAGLGPRLGDHDAVGCPDA
jgi:DNA-binding transcriptional LysR family regulator